MELKKMIEIMQHFENGGEVEISSKNGDCWTKITSPSWDWVYHEYRIKPEKQKITIEKWLCSDKQGSFVVVETTNIEEYTYITKKLKLIESYEVEL